MSSIADSKDGNCLVCSYGFHEQAVAVSNYMAWKAPGVQHQRGSMVHLQVHSNGPVLDDEILEDAEVQDAIKTEGSVHRKYKILNTDRATFGRVGGAVAKLHGDSGFAGSLSFDLEVKISPLHTWHLS